MDTINEDDVDELADCIVCIPATQPDEGPDDQPDR